LGLGRFFNAEAQRDAELIGRFDGVSVEKQAKGWGVSKWELRGG